MTKTKGFLLTAGIVLATTFTLSCSSNDDNSSGDENSSSSENNPSGNSSSSSLNSSSSSEALSSSSSRDDGYLSCEELENLLKDGFMGGDLDTYMDGLKISCETKHTSELQNCNRDRQCGINILAPCMSEDKDVKQLCGGNDMETCGNHYDTAGCGRN